MEQELSKLLLYGDLDADSILMQLGGIYSRWKRGARDGELVRDIHTQIRRLLYLTTR